MHVYLDWNVFDRIEKKEKIEEEQRGLFARLETLILNKKIICPYSNAHINDLLRGYANNPIFIPDHLETLKRLTNNLCVVQYWGKDQTLWHYRDVYEFFNSALEDKKGTAKSFTELLNYPEAEELWKSMINRMRATPVMSNFKELYNQSSVFKLMFPRTKTEMTMLSFCEDLYDFAISEKKDYSIYKSLRSYANQAKAKLKNPQKFLKGIDEGITDPTYLNYDEAWDKYTPKTQITGNPAYQRITDTYCKIDFQGYKSDDKFSNLIDDSLHVFYGAHCDYFVTIDDKCHYKATETYHKLGISTKAMKPTEFLSHHS